MFLCLVIALGAVGTSIREALRGPEIVGVLGQLLGQAGQLG